VRKPRISAHRLDAKPPFGIGWAELVGANQAREGVVIAILRRQRERLGQERLDCRLAIVAGLFNRLARERERLVQRTLLLA
jgi:hypothetical protein